jgi:hypothetical protein
MNRPLLRCNTRLYYYLKYLLKTLLVYRSNLKLSPDSARLTVFQKIQDNSVYYSFLQAYKAGFYLVGDNQWNINPSIGELHNAVESERLAVENQ